jgi:hypothetical protein
VQVFADPAPYRTFSHPRDLRRAIDERRLASGPGAQWIAGEGLAALEKLAPPVPALAAGDRVAVGWAADDGRDAPPATLLVERVDPQGVVTVSVPVSETATAPRAFPPAFLPSPAVVGRRLALHRLPR